MLLNCLEKYLVCPVCDSFLKLTDNTLKCSHSHSFDVAREGYVNLLPVTHRRSSHPGDSKEMLISRKQFLDRGHYLQLSDLINELVENYLREEIICQTDATRIVLDAGSGTGYYLSKISDHIAKYSTDKCVCYVGVDISKTACRIASKSDPGSCYIVANIFRKLPLVEHSVDVLLTVFAPWNKVEFERLLKVGGLLIMVTPGARHLEELRALANIASEIGQTAELRKQELSHEFDYVNSVAIESMLDLRQPDITNLFRMTPYYWQTSMETRTTIEHIPQLIVSVDFRISIYRLIS